MSAAGKNIAVIVNPNAGRSSERGRGEVVAELRRRLSVDVVATSARGSGIGLAADAGKHADLVVAFGGDGHVNEVVNGLAGTGCPLAIIPGGTMNVFARALGVPLDPFAAIDHIQARLGRPPRTVPLGVMDDRFFTFAAGCGFDAEAAARVNRYVPSKRRFGELFFYWSAFRVLLGSYRHRSPWMTLAGDFGEVPVVMVIASNTGPYAYLFGRPIRVAPAVDLEGGVDAFALRTMRIENLPSYALRCAVTGDIAHHPDAFYASGQEGFEVSADRPFDRHVDGEALPPSTRARFSVARDALLVLG